MMKSICKKIPQKTRDELKGLPVFLTIVLIATGCVVIIMMQLAPEPLSTNYMDPVILD